MSSFFSAPSSNSSTNSSTNSEPPSNLSTWLTRVSSAQLSRQTPEAISSAQARAQSREAVARAARRCERLATVQAYSRCAFVGGNLGVRSSAPTFSAPSPALLTSFGAAATPQTREQATARALQTEAALTTLQRAASEDDEEAADAALEEARVQLESAGQAWATRGREGAEEANLMLVAADGYDSTSDSSPAGELAGVLADFKDEPTDDEALTARFKLYETHAETVANTRRALFNFWGDAKDQVPAGAYKSSIEASLRNIDDESNLGIEEDPRHWFIYSMALKVTSNETRLGTVLNSIRSKLSVLANTDDCPICLEAIDDFDTQGTILGCCHKLHSECWRNWKAHCATQYKQPFCPLCREDEFLEEILSPAHTGTTTAA